jgi:two-component system, OmpR family, response regulator VicR
MKILICEDNKLALKTLNAVLQREGYATVSAPDGNAAMLLIQTQSFDLIIVDIHLPYHSGLEIVKHLRTDLKKDTSVLIITAFSDPQVQQQAGELGIQGYIVKPFNPSDAVNQIRSILRN